MSSSVSPRQRDIGEVASLRAEGVDRQPRSGFQRGWQNRHASTCLPSTLNSQPTLNPSACGTSPIRAPRGRGGHCYVSTFNSTPLTENTPYRSNHRGGHCYVSTAVSQTSQRVFPISPTSHTINPQLSTIDVFPLKIHRSASSLKIPFPNKHKKSGEPRLAAFNISTTGINRLLLPCEQSNQALC